MGKSIGQRAKVTGIIIPPHCPPEAEFSDVSRINMVVLVVVRIMSVFLCVDGGQSKNYWWRSDIFKKGHNLYYFVFCCIHFLHFRSLLTHFPAYMIHQSNGNLM